MEKTRCIVCNKNIHSYGECKENELELCEECIYEVSHIEICPLINEISEEITYGLFREVWSKNKDNLRELSKRELAEKVFCAGISEGLHFSLFDVGKGKL